MRISDVFALPSISEGCSVIMLEAALAKNLVVLNDDLFSLNEFGGQKLEPSSSDRALYFSFGSITRPLTSYLPSEEEWLKEHARLLIQYLLQEKSLQFFRLVRKRFSGDYIYENQLAPLIEGN